MINRSKAKSKPKEKHGIFFIDEVRMNTLFPLEPVAPAGFRYFPDFITSEEEDELLDEIARIELHTFLFQGYEAKRKVASFGYDWNFEHRKLSKGKDIPPAFEPLISKTASFLSLPAEGFAELLLTEYPEGSVINWHRDAAPFDVIAGISLMSDCSFRFRPYDKSNQKRSSVISLSVKQRSLYVIQDSARTDWEHSILPVKQKRYSITLRTLK